MTAVTKRHGCQVILGRPSSHHTPCNRRPTTQHHNDPESTWWVCADCEARFDLTNPVETP